MAMYYIMVFILGLLVGSFANVCIYRIPDGKSIVVPPSACMSCGSRLRPLDLVPVFSFLFLKGKCRYCGKPVSSRYPLVELMTAAVFTGVFAKYGLTPYFFAFIFLMTILIIVFFIDIDHRIIPDGLVIAGLAGGIALFAWNIYKPMSVVYGDEKWWTPLLGAISGSGILLAVAIIGLIIYKSDDAMGMGDVKLLAPIGVFLGWRLGLAALFISIVLAGIVSLVLIITGVKKKKDTIPFGPFIVIGTFLTILFGWDLLNWYTSRL